MEQTVKLPYCSRYFPGDLIGLRWLKAVTSNDRLSARRLNWHTHDELELIFPLRGHYRYEFKGHRSIVVDNESFLIIPRATSHRMAEAIDPPGGRLHLYLRNPSGRITADGTFTAHEYARLYQTMSRRTLKSIPSTPLLKTAIAALGKIVPQDRSPCPTMTRCRPGSCAVWRFAPAQQARPPRRTSHRAGFSQKPSAGWNAIIRPVSI